MGRVKSLKEGQRSSASTALLPRNERYWTRDLRGMRSNAIFRLGFRAPSLLAIGGALALYYLTSHLRGCYETRGIARVARFRPSVGACWLDAWTQSESPPRATSIRLGRSWNSMM